jgi:hypothetical protein
MQQLVREHFTVYALFHTPLPGMDSLRSLSGMSSESSVRGDQLNTVGNTTVRPHIKPMHNPLGCPGWRLGWLVDTLRTGHHHPKTLAIQAQSHAPLCHRRAAS